MVGNHKRVYRVFCDLKLNQKRRAKKRLPQRVKQPLLVPNRVGSADFMGDMLYTGKRFRTFNVLDDFNRGTIHIEIDTSITGRRLTPVSLNAYIERFNWTYRNKLLDLYRFRDLDEVREATYWWLLEYNEQRPHDSLDDLTPVEYLSKNAGNSIFQLSSSQGSLRSHSSNKSTGAAISL